MQGFEIAKKATLAFLEQFKENAESDDRELLRCVARTSLRTKLHEKLADQLTDIVVEAVLTIRRPDKLLDLFMVMRLAVYSDKYIISSKSNLVPPKEHFLSLSVPACKKVAIA